MPIHLLPGPTDPSGTILPQRSLPRAMFGGAAGYTSFFCETNPAYIHVNTAPSTTPQHPQSRKASTSKLPSTTFPALSRTFLINSGQPVDDMFKYLPSPHTRLSMTESTLRWRHMAPTAPDTLWCHPYFSDDPFIISETPDFYIIGNQPDFKTKLVTEKARKQPSDDGDPEVTEHEPEKRCRIVLVPNFHETGTVVLVNLRTLDVKTVSFSVNELMLA